MSKTNYTKLANSIMELVGGKENVSYFARCTTRLRFNLKDRGLVKIDEIGKVSGVLGSQWSGEQLQIIIGPDVDDAYKAICEIANFNEEDAIDEELDDAAIIKENSDQNQKSAKTIIKKFFSKMVDGLVGSISPLIPMLIGGGMIKIIALLMNQAGVSPDNTTYMILSWVGNAFLYSFPVFLGATSAKKFGVNQGIGMLLGALLISPDFISAVSSGTALDFLGLPVYSGSYSSSVIPIIITVWVLSKLQRFLDKYSPKSLKGMLVPTLSLLIMVPIMLVVTAPLGFYIGKYVSGGILWLYNRFGFIGIAVLTGFKPLLVMTGMHLGMIPVVVNNFAVLGFDPIWLPASIVSNFNQGFACLAVGIKTKDKDLRSIAFSSALTVFLAGVTEPAMYSVTIKYRKPMVASIVGGIVAGVILGAFKVVCYTMPGNTGILSLPTFMGSTSSNLIILLIAIAVGAVITFIGTWITFKEEKR